MAKIPSVTVEQMREVDRLMVEEMGVSILMMMENAARSVAILARKMLDGGAKNKRIIILCGKGNNGGDGLGATRHLINFGASVSCFLATKAEELNQNSKVQYKILQGIQADLRSFYGPGCFSLLEDFLHADLIIDGLIGYSLEVSPKEPVATFIKKANESKKPILAIDIPSGLDGDSGLPNNPTIKASSTITLALPKVGLVKGKAKDYVGKLYLADLSVPQNVYEKIGLDVPNIFAKQEIVPVPNN